MEGTIRYDGTGYTSGHGADQLGMEFVVICPDAYYLDVGDIVTLTEVCTDGTHEYTRPSDGATRYLFDSRVALVAGQTKVVDLATHFGIDPDPVSIGDFVVSDNDITYLVTNTHPLCADDGMGYLQDEVGNPTAMPFELQRVNSSLGTVWMASGDMKFTAHYKVA